MVSGVGLNSTLETHGIPIVSKLAGVGQNLWDHVLGGISRRVRTFGTGAISGSGSRSIQDESLAQYLSEPPRGPHTTFTSDVFAFEKLSAKTREKLSNSTQAALAEFADDWPEIGYFVNNGFNGP